MEGPAEDQGITYQDLLCYFETHGDAAEMRREKCDQEEGGVCSRWKPFEAFRREVQGEEVMTSTDDGILRDYLPGTYPMAEIVQFTDLPDLLPARASVPGVRLVSFSLQSKHQNQQSNWGGRREARAPLLDSSFQLALMVKSRRRYNACDIILTSNYLCNFHPSRSSLDCGQTNLYLILLPSLQIASTETLGYYGARIAESCKSENVTLSARWININMMTKTKKQAYNLSCKALFGRLHVPPTVLAQVGGEKWRWGLPFSSKN